MDEAAPWQDARVSYPALASAPFQPVTTRQDNTALHYTPLHVAARRDVQSVVSDGLMPRSIAYGVVS